MAYRLKLSEETDPIKIQKRRLSNRLKQQKWRERPGSKELKCLLQQKYNRTLHGYSLHLYRKIKDRIKNCPSYKNRKLQFSLEEFIIFLEDSPFKELHNKWVENDYTIKLSPSVDRIDNKGNYTLDNIQIITQSENSRKGTK